MNSRNDVSVRLLHSLQDFWSILLPPTVHPGKPMCKTGYLLAKKAAREESGMTGTGDIDDDRYLAIRGYGVGRATKVEENQDVERAVVIAGDLLKPYDYHYDVLELVSFFTPTLACLLEVRLPKEYEDGPSEETETPSAEEVIFWARVERILHMYLTEQLVGPKSSYEDRMAFYKSKLKSGARMMVFAGGILSSYRRRSMEEDTSFIPHYRHKKFIDHWIQDRQWRLAKRREEVRLRLNWHSYAASIGGSQVPSCGNRSCACVENIGKTRY
ncbi:hypothetical protein CC1G_04083 [Coprinopsis cinerea okayama7|uniref:Uncharacterized protein n=1 Tax=Coprinopsis cinerea (strain Okayama-7 / 130 / ATCC MYA-4618 / FGSC 9003) TaxID=240176 RepID=A8NVW8_COPC7|nr:hypothetical protein CC1G_04083 [Coprinopsis cinerea okayama7\|eukprot:XP_001836770.2 hypothetical protein CC1G_04083 [Coprinopsis cinerea okayama7\